MGGLEKVLRVAIVDDQKSDSDVLRDGLLRYGKENGESFDVTVFSNGVNFLDAADFSYDLIFLDIRMPFLNGIDTARRIRKLNDVSCLVFVTNMTGYALSGYEVDASDYILKPIDYPVFAYKMKRLVQIAGRKKRRSIAVKVSGGISMVEISDILYVEMVKHKVVYHLLSSTLESWDTLSNVYGVLKDYGFAYCNSGYIVNLRMVKDIIGNTVSLYGDITLPISRNRKEKFVEEFTLSIGRD